MLRMFYLSLFLVSSVSVFAFGHRPMAEEDKTWICHTVKDYSYKVQGDTAIEGLSYKRLYITDTTQYGDDMPHYFAALRDEEYKTFIRYSNCDSEMLLYDFTPNESVFYEFIDYPESDVEVRRLTNEALIAEMDDGCQYRVFFISVSQSGVAPTRSFYWLEGVGCTGDPFLPSTWWNDNAVQSCTINRLVLYNADSFNRLIHKSLGLLDYEEYVPLVRAGVQWVYYHDNCLTGEAWDYAINFAGPVEIGDKTYQVLCYHVIDPNLSGAYPAGYVREEGRRVYWLENSVDNKYEMLLFDFNDMRNVYPEETFTRGYVEVDGKLRGAFFDDGELAFIEGIGSANSGLLPSFVLQPDGSQEGLSYVTENGRIVFKGPRYDDHLFYLQHGLSKFKCDLNGDDEVNVADISSLYQEIIKQENPGVGIYDTNGDGEVNVADVSTLYGVILQ